jgi:hypothetical protein
MRNRGAEKGCEQGAHCSVVKTFIILVLHTVKTLIIMVFHTWSTFTLIWSTAAVFNASIRRWCGRVLIALDKKQVAESWLWFALNKLMNWSGKQFELIIILIVIFVVWIHVTWNVILAPAYQDLIATYQNHPWWKLPTVVKTRTQALSLAVVILVLVVECVCTEQAVKAGNPEPLYKSSDAIRYVIATVLMDSPKIPENIYHPIVIVIGWIWSPLLPLMSLLRFITKTSPKVALYLFALVK